MMWDLWKKGFTAWERATSSYVERVLAHPGVLEPAGAMLTAVIKTKLVADRAVDAWWSMCGLPSKRDQERTLHELHQVQSQLYDLQEQLDAEREP